MHTKGLLEREPEMSTLLGAFSVLESGESNVVVVRGESGTGKSFLVDEFLRRVEQQDVAVCLTASAVEFARRSESYQLFRVLIQQMIDVDLNVQSSLSSTSDSSKRRRLAERTLKVLITESRELLDTIAPDTPFHYIADTLSKDPASLEKWVEWARHRNGQRLTSITDATQLLAGITRLLEPIARTTPLVIAIDDLQWSDSSSLQALLHLLAELRAPVLFVLIVDTSQAAVEAAVEAELRTFLAALTKRHHPKMVDLDEAQRARGLDFCRAIVKRESLVIDDGLVNELFTRSAGNPLFATELMSLLSAERGAPAAEAWEQLPERLVDSIDRRLSMLPRELMAILEIASVEGTSFSVDALAAVMKMDLLPLLELLDVELGQKRSLVVDATMDDDSTGAGAFGRVSRFRFRHGIYRDYIYKVRISPARRQELHRQIVQRLTLPPHQESFAVLANHHERAGNWEEAARFLTLAAEESFGLADYTAAATSSTRGLQLARRSNALQALEAQSWVSTLYVTAASVERSRGRFKEAGELAEEGLGVARREGRTVVLLKSERARSLYNRDIEMDLAKEILEDCLRLISSMDDKDIEYDLRRQLGILNSRAGHYGEAIQEFMIALRTFPSPNLQTHRLAELVDSTSVVLSLVGDLCRSVKWNQVAQGLGTRAHLVTRATLYFNNSVAPLRRLGELNDALQRSKDAGRLAIEQGKVGANARAKYEEALCLAALGRASESKKLLEETLNETPPNSDSPHLAYAALELALIGLANHEILTARRWLDDANSRSVGPRQVTGTSELRSFAYVEGALALAEGRLDDATRHFSDLLSAELVRESEGCWAWAYLRFVGAAGLALSNGNDLLTRADEFKELWRTATARCSARGMRSEVERLVHALPGGAENFGHLLNELDAVADQEIQVADDDWPEIVAELDRMEGEIRREYGL